METQRNNTKWWILGLIAAIIISLGFGLLVGGVGGYFLGSKGVLTKSASLVVTPSRDCCPCEEEPTPSVQPTPRSRMPQLPVVEQGAVVRWVEEGGPADQAGLREGDIIIAVNGQAVTLQRDLAALVRAYQPGDRITLTVLRQREDSRTQEESKIQVKLGSTRDDQGRTVAYLGIRYSMLPVLPSR